MQLKSHVSVERSRAANIRSFIAFNLSEGALLPTYCVASCIMCLLCGPRHAPRLFTLGCLNKLVIAAAATEQAGVGGTEHKPDPLPHRSGRMAYHVDSFLQDSTPLGADNH